MRESGSFENLCFNASSSEVRLARSICLHFCVRWMHHEAFFDNTVGTLRSLEMCNINDADMAIELYLLQAQDL
jgi:hypothetical protein